MSDAYQLGHSAREYIIVSRIINDILKIIDLISVVSSRFGIGKRLLGKEKDTWLWFQL